MRSPSTIAAVATIAGRGAIVRGGTIATVFLATILGATIAAILVVTAVASLTVSTILVVRTTIASVLVVAAITTLAVAVLAIAAVATIRLLVVGLRTVSTIAVAILAILVVAVLAIAAVAVAVLAITTLAVAVLAIAVASQTVGILTVAILAVAVLAVVVIALGLEVVISSLVTGLLLAIAIASILISTVLVLNLALFFLVRGDPVVVGPTLSLGPVKAGCLKFIRNISGATHGRPGQVVLIRVVLRLLPDRCLNSRLLDSGSLRLIESETKASFIKASSDLLWHLNRGLGCRLLRLEARALRCNRGLKLDWGVKHIIGSRCSEWCSLVGINCKAAIHIEVKISTTKVGLNRGDRSSHIANLETFTIRLENVISENIAESVSHAGSLEGHAALVGDFKVHVGETTKLGFVSEFRRAGRLGSTTKRRLLWVSSTDRCSLNLNRLRRSRNVVAQVEAINGSFRDVLENKRRVLL